MYHTGSHTTADDHSQITIRLAGSEHAEQVRRLAQRDSAVVPGGEVLVALVGEQMRAAISIGDGRVIADPFHPTAELVALLSERVFQLRGAKGRGRRLRIADRMRGGRSHRRARLSPQPAGTLRAFD